MNTNKPVLETIAQLRNTNLSWSKIARALNKKGFKTATGMDFKGSNAASVFNYYQPSTISVRTEIPREELNPIRTLVGRLTVSQKLSNREWLETVRAVVNF